MVFLSLLPFFCRDLKDVGAKKIEVYSLNKVTQFYLSLSFILVLTVFFSFTTERSVAKETVECVKELSLPRMLR